MANSTTDSGGFTGMDRKRARPWRRSRAMLAAASNAGANNAAEAYARWKGFTPLLDAGARGFMSDPSYAIVPR